jgi:hypothetical protein
MDDSPLLLLMSPWWTSLSVPRPVEQKRAWRDHPHLQYDVIVVLLLLSCYRYRVIVIGYSVNTERNTRVSKWSFFLSIVIGFIVIVGGWRHDF